MTSDAFSGWGRARKAPPARLASPPPLAADDPRLVAANEALEQAKEKARMDDDRIQKLLEQIVVLKEEIARLSPAPVPAAPHPNEGATALDRLRERALLLGLKVDMRWGAERIQREIAQAEAPAP